VVMTSAKSQTLMKVWMTPRMLEEGAEGRERERSLSSSLNETDARKVKGKMHSRRADHVRYRTSDLDGKESGDTDEESKDSLEKTKPREERNELLVPPLLPSNRLERKYSQ